MTGGHTMMGQKDCGSSPKSDERQGFREQGRAKIIGRGNGQERQLKIELSRQPFLVEYGNEETRSLASGEGVEILSKRRNVAEKPGGRGSRAGTPRKVLTFG